MSEYDDDPTPQPIIVRPRTPMESLGETITRVGTGVIPSRKTTYHGIVMRSRLEVRFARHLDELGERWVYEPRVFGSKGSGYLPDFEILDGGRPIYVEVKPTLAEVPAAKAKASVIWRTFPDALILVAVEEGCTFYGGLRGQGWEEWQERWAA